MFNPSANVVTLSARPSPSVSSSTFTESRPLVPGLAGNGYSTVEVTHNRPRASNAIFIGLLICGSAANNSTRNPSGTENVFASAAGDSGFVVRTPAANGSSAVNRTANRMPKTTQRMPQCAAGVSGCQSILRSRQASIAIGINPIEQHLDGDQNQ